MVALMASVMALVTPCTMGTGTGSQARKSEPGPKYRTAFEVADVLVGRLVAAIQARPTYADEDWLILMCTDHGRTDEGGHGGDSDGRSVASAGEEGRGR